MLPSMTPGLLIATAAGIFFCQSACAESESVYSPNGRVRVEFNYTDQGLSYAVSYDGKAIIDPSVLALKADGRTFGLGKQSLSSLESRSVDETFSLVAGKAREVVDRYNESVFNLTQAGQVALKYSVIVRAYDSGAAVRFAINDQGGTLKTLNIMEEQTQFSFPHPYDCWGINQGKYSNSHEGEFDRFNSASMRQHNLFDYPLVCKTGSGETTFALAEADVNHYPASWLSGSGSGARVVLTPRADNDPGARLRSIAAKLNLSTEPFKTPWRAVMIGDRPGDLVASTLIAQLAEPSKIADTGWIKPGKAAWDWWSDWSVDVPNPGINTQSYKAYIDFAKQAGLEYILIDEGWSVGSSTEANPNADLTKTIPAVDMPAIVKYAADRGIGVWVWAQWQQLDQQMEPALDQFRDWGLKGIKVDFLDRSDQEIVDYYYRLLSKSAERKLMVDLHGAFAPTGLARTFPNFLTQEGVMGAEYNKWSKRITATHNVTLPFTRMILGPIDYTPGGFRAQTPSEFSPRNKDPFVQTTRGQAVAMYVVYDSPFTMLADSPAAYVNPDGSWADGADFIRKVPATWDETRVLSGDIGQYIVTARRSGDTWYVGAMTNEAGRTVTVPLDFLKGGSYIAEVLQDGENVNALTKTEHILDAGKILTLALAPSGGAAVKLSVQTAAKKTKKPRFPRKRR